MCYTSLLRDFLAFSRVHSTPVPARRRDWPPLRLVSVIHACGSNKKRIYGSVVSKCITYTTYKLQCRRLIIQRALRFSSRIPNKRIYRELRKRRGVVFARARGGVYNIALFLSFSEIDIGVTRSSDSEFMIYL